MHATTLIAKLLKILNIEKVFGLVGIPIVELADELQKEGIQFFAHRSEAAATYAAAAYAFLTYSKDLRPGCALCTGGPGMINALAGVTHATVNRIPFLLLGGSASLLELNKGAFQELDQVGLCDRLCQLNLCKASFICTTTESIAMNLVQAASLAISNPPGTVYVDFPRNVLEANLEVSESIKSVNFVQDALKSLLPAKIQKSPPDVERWEQVLSDLENASKPLFIVGDAVAMEGAEVLIERICSTLEIPLLPCPMARGVIKDSHPLCMTSVRSLVLREADFVILAGTQLNWMLHFGKPPRWNPSVKFVIIDYCNEKTRSSILQNRQVIAIFDKGSVFSMIEQLGNHVKLVNKTNSEKNTTKRTWLNFLQEQKQFKLNEHEAKLKSIWLNNEQKTSNSQESLSFLEAFLLLQHELDAWKAKSLPETPRKITIVSEGSRTMDLSRVYLKIDQARGRLDAGQWGTMGLGLAYVLAAFLAGLNEPSADHLVVAVEGDSAIGFSLAELETLARYKANALIIVFDNGGIYTGKKSNSSQLLPTQLTYGTGYEMIMESVGGKGLRASNTKDYQVALQQLLSVVGTRLLHVMIDPNEGTSPNQLKY